MFIFLLEKSSQKYHVAWLFGEIGAIASGLGFSGANQKTGEAEFGNVEQVAFIAHLKSTNVSDTVTEWNKGVSRWLRNYVYLRIVPHVKRGEKRRKLFLGMMTTMGVSALWHGPYPGYFVFWSLLAFAQTADKHFEAKISKRFITEEEWTRPFPGKFLQVLGFIVIKIFISYSCTAFHILYLKDIVNYYNRLYWFVHISLLVAWVTLTVMPPLPQRGTPSASAASTPKPQTPAKKLEPNAGSAEPTTENSGIRKAEQQSNKKMD